jgi:hypothetical protein
VEAAFTLCITPLAIGVILLLAEYFVVQPLQDARDSSALRSDENIDSTWSKAIKSAILKFKHYQSSSSMLSNERVKIEEVEIRHNVAKLVITVTPRASLLLLLGRIYSSMNLGGWSIPTKTKYRMTVDSSGDIQEIRFLEETVIRDAKNSGRAPLPTSHPQDGIVLKEVQEPKIQVSLNKLEVTIRFIVENWGEPRRIHPKVQYKVAQLINGEFRERLVTSPDDWIVQLEPNSINPLSFVMEFGETNIVVLTKSPNKVSVKLIPVSS